MGRDILPRVAADARCGWVAVGVSAPVVVVLGFLFWASQDLVRGLDGLELGVDFGLLARVAIGVVF